MPLSRGGSKFVSTAIKVAKSGTFFLANLSEWNYINSSNHIIKTENHLLYENRY